MIDANLKLASISGSILKVLLFLGVALALSWGLAILWSAHGDWWLRVLPEDVKKGAYSLFKGLLSADVAEAEDQLDFYLFWIPSFVIAIAVLLAGCWAWREFVGR